MKYFEVGTYVILEIFVPHRRHPRFQWSSSVIRNSKCREHVAWFDGDEIAQCVQKDMSRSEDVRRRANTLFYFMLTANACLYLEAGAVPAVLLQIGHAFDMSSGAQGLLGGIVYLALSVGGPFAGYLLRRYSHQRVLAMAVTMNCVLTFIWATTPVGRTWSPAMFIGVRFLMGLAQCVICVFLPLWTNEYAPKNKRASWMSYLQASVPLGVMGGYIIASIVLSLNGGGADCGPVMCWRIPFFVEIGCLVPICIGIFFVPSELLSFNVHKRRGTTDSTGRVKVQAPRDRAAAAVQLMELGAASAQPPPSSRGQLPSESSESTPLMSPEDRPDKNTEGPNFSPGKYGLQQDQLGLLQQRQHQQEQQHFSYEAVRHAARDDQGLTPDTASPGVPPDGSNRLSSLSQYRVQTSMFTPIVTRSFSFKEGSSSRDNLPGLEDIWGSSPAVEVGYGDGNISDSGDSSSQAVTPLATNSEVAGTDVADITTASSVQTLGTTAGEGDAADEDGEEESITGLGIRKTLRSVLGISATKREPAVASSSSSSSSSSSVTREVGDGLKYASLNDAAREHRSGLIENGTKLLARRGSGGGTTSSSVTTGQEISPVDSPFPPGTVGTLSDAGIGPGQPPGPSAADRRESTRSTDFSRGNSFRSLRTDSDSEDDDTNVDVASDGYPTMDNYPCKRKSVWVSLEALTNIPVYYFLLGAMSSLYFTVTGVQYWGTSYMTVALGAPVELVNTMFILCAATGPTFGVFFGGWCVDKRGGYKGHEARVRALEMCSTFGFVACSLAVTISFAETIWTFTPLLWLLLFFGGAILPACSGIVVSVVPRRHRTVSSSVSLVVYNMFGYCLSLVLSGYFMEFLASVYPSCDFVCGRLYGFRIVLYWSGFAIIWLGLATNAARKAANEARRRKASNDSANWCPQTIVYPSP